MNHSSSFSLSLVLISLLGFGKCESGSEFSNGNFWLDNKTSSIVQNFKYVLESKPIFETDSNETGIVSHSQLLLSKYLHTFLPPFAVTDENVRNPQCRIDSETFLENLRKFKLWAVKMFDSSGKLPSGLLNGNVNQFGDFDQCLSVEDETTNIKGKYCLAFLQILPNSYESKAFSDIYNLMHSYSAFRSKLSDPGHRVPRFSSINWAFCVPDSCSSEDVEQQLKTIIEKYSNGTGFEIEVKVETEMCQVKKPFKISLPFFIVSLLFAFVIAISAIATFSDFTNQRNEEESENVSLSSLMMCFSLKRNVEQLVNLKRSPDDIESIHGIRMINAIMLMISHKSMALFFNPYTNRTYMAENLGQTWSVLARAASLYTDPFIMMSGVLTSYCFIKTLRKNKSLDLKKEYISRLVRIVPPLAAVILVCTFILPELGSGPQWNLAVLHHAEKCRNYWWRNFLFIHNYFGFENMCLTHTHHLGIDTQLFLTSPLLVFALFKWPVLGLSVLVSLASVSTALRYQATIERNLSYFVYPGTSIAQMFDTADYSYIIPSHRLTVYVIGIILGYVLQYCGREYKMKRTYRRLGWMIAFSLMYYSFVKPSRMSRTGYVYDKYDAALYAALAPVGWCLFFAWIIFLTHIGYGGRIGRMLSSKYMMIWTRISYAVYLTQFPIFFFNIGLQRSAQPYSFFLLISLLEYGVIMAASIGLTLFFDFPFTNIKKLVLQR